MSEQTIRSWLIETLGDEEKGKDCVKISILHENVSGLTTEVTSIVFGGQVVKAELLAKRIINEARNYVNAADSVQTFWLQAFYRDDPQPGRRISFRTAPPSDNNTLTEPPTKTGMVRQAMRHTEFLFQMHTRQETGIIGHYERLLNMSMNLNTKLMEENHDALEVVKNVYMEQAKADHESEMEKLKYERATHERKKLLSYIPGLVNQLLGEEVFPPSTVDSSIIEQIVENLNEEKAKKLVPVLQEVLEPDQFALIAKRIADMMEAQRKTRQLAERNATVEAAEAELQ